MSIVPAAGRDCKEEDDDVARFMQTPLVKWVKTFKKSKENLDFEELNDSVFLLDVLLTIDEGIDGDVLASINRSTSMDNDIKLRNWMLLAKTLHRYYADYLQQVILSFWPDVFAMTEETDRGSCLRELQKCLILILGYAVQCDRKENHIEAIKSLDVETQQALVLHIQQVTEEGRNVLSLADGNHVDPILLSQTVQDLCRERLQMMQKVLVLSSIEGDETGNPTKRRNCKDRDAEHGKKIRALNEELEEKSKLLTETRTELSTVNSELSRTKSENTILSAEAKIARAYKDELDNMKEMVIQSEKYRKEIQKYKNVLAGVDFYKTRLDDLRKDNDLVLESKAEVEEQLVSSNKRIASIMDELVLSQKNLENSNSEKADLNKKLAELAEENARMEFEISEMKGGLLLSNMSRFTSVTSIDCLPPLSELKGISQTRGNSISDEMNETLTRHMSRLQMENDELRMKWKESTDRQQDVERKIEELRRQQEEEFHRKLEAVQQQLSQQSIRSSRELTKELEQKVLEIEQRNAKQKQKMSKDFEQKLSETERQNQSLQQHIEELQKQKMSKDFEQKLSETERQNQSLQQHIEELQKQIKFIDETRRHDKELCTKLHGTKEEDVQLSERRQVKRAISLIHDNSHDKIVAQQQTKAEFIEKETNNPHSQTKKIDPCNDTSISTPSQINNHPRPNSSLSSSELKDKHNLTTASSQSSAVDMDASYRSDHSFSSTTTTSRDSPFSRAESLRRSNTIAVSRSGEEGGRSRIQGIVTPVMRSTEKTPTTDSSGHPSHSTQKRLIPIDILRDRLGNTFSRTDKHRHTLPTKMSLDRPHSRSSPSKYYRLESSGGGHRGLAAASPGSGYSRPPQMAPYGQQHSHSVSSEKRHSSSISSSRDYDDASLRSHHLNSSTASEAREFDESQHRPHSSSSSRDAKNADVRQTKWQISSYYEKVITRTLESLELSDDESRCRALVDQILKLQAQNDQLLNKYSDLREKTQTTKGLEEKLSSLEERNLELEKENRKLKQIIDSVFGSGSQSLYDKRTYQFNTSV